MPKQSDKEIKHSELDNEEILASDELLDLEAALDQIDHEPTDTHHAAGDLTGSDTPAAPSSVPSSTPSSEAELTFAEDEPFANGIDSANSPFEDPLLNPMSEHKPDEAPEEQESLVQLEQEIGDLLDHFDQDDASQQQLESNIDADLSFPDDLSAASKASEAASDDAMPVSTATESPGSAVDEPLSETDADKVSSGSDIPDTPVTDDRAEPSLAAEEKESKTAKPRSMLFNSLMLTLGLVAILIASLAVWLVIDSADNKTAQQTATTNLQEQIKLLNEQHKQQYALLEKKVDSLEKQIVSLTAVVSHKNAEQWRNTLTQGDTDRSPKVTLPPQTRTYQARTDQSKAKSGAKQLAEATKTPSKPKSGPAPVEPTPVSRAKTATVNKAPAVTPVQTTAPSNQPGAKVATAKANDARLAEYEVAPGTVNGWVVNIFSVESKSTAARKVRELLEKDIHAEFVRVNVKGKSWYRVRASGLKNRQAAIALKQMLSDYYGYDTWYSYLKPGR